MNAAVALLAFAAVCSAQVCTTRGLSSVARAQTSAGTGDAAGARKWLDQAERECPTSAAVMREIGKVYGLLNDSVRAALYERQARALAPKDSGTVTERNLETAAAPPAPEIEDASFVREKFALIVGVGNFQSSDIRKLAYTAKDASDLAAVLRDPSFGRFKPENVQVLTDEKATLVNIRTAINTIARVARPEDLVLLYFSSHGSSPDADVATEQGKTGYVVTYDTDPANLYATAFPMEELGRVVQDRLRAARIVTFLDTCYAGDTIRRGASGGRYLTQVAIPESAMTRIAQGKGRAIITSSRSTERSWESDELQNGFFTYHLLEALRSRNGLLTVSEIYNYLQARVPRAVMEKKKAPQTPMMLPEGKRVGIVIGTSVE